MFFFVCFKLGISAKQMIHAADPVSSGEEPPDHFSQIIFVTPPQGWGVPWECAQAAFLSRALERDHSSFMCHRMSLKSGKSARTPLRKVLSSVNSKIQSVLPVLALGWSKTERIYCANLLCLLQCWFLSC